MSPLSKTIWYWFGTLATIPPGYLLCNGLNGTPDLRGKFTLAASPGGARPPDSSGGNSTHTHAYSDATHVHTIRDDGGIASGTDKSLTTDPALITFTTGAESSLPSYHALLPIMVA